MAEVTDWSPVDDNNNTAPPVGWPEGMVPSAVNNAARAMQGALKREHDRIVAGTQDLPYVKRSGDTMTGNLAVNGGGGLTIGVSTNLQNIANGLLVTNAAGGAVTSRGPVSGFQFGDRNQSSPDWVWYASANLARLALSGTGDLLSVNASGNLAATGSVTAAQYNIGGTILANRGPGGETWLYDGAAQITVNMQATGTYYDNGSHTFRNEGGGTTWATISSAGIAVPAGNIACSGTLSAATLNVTTVNASNVTASGTVTAAYVASTGDVHADNAVTAPSVTATGTVQGSFLNSTSNANVAGNLTVGNDVRTNYLYVGGKFFARSIGVGTEIFDSGGQQALYLQPNYNYYRADNHHFQNDGGGDTFNVDASGNASFAGTISAPNVTLAGTATANQLTSTGNINAAADVGCRDIFSSRNIWATSGTMTAGTLVSQGSATIAGTCTAANFVGAFAAPPGANISVPSGTVSAQNVTASGNISAPSGTVSAQNVTASSNVTASGTVTGNSVVCGSGVFQNTGPSNLIGQTTFGPSGSWARIDATASYNVTGSWLTFSDRAVKEAITPYTAGLDAVNQLEPVSYTYTSEIEQTPVTRYGLVAQDVAPIVPEMVGEGVTPGGTTMATLNGGHTVWLLVNAVKELSAKVSALEAQLAAA